MSANKLPTGAIIFFEEGYPVEHRACPTEAELLSEVQKIVDDRTDPNNAWIYVAQGRDDIMAKIRDIMITGYGEAYDVFPLMQENSIFVLGKYTRTIGEYAGNIPA